MNPRLAVALPVLPALAHAATLRWAAADLAERFSAGGFFEVVEGMEDISVLLAGFASVLVVVAMLTPGLVRLLGAFLLFVSLPLQFIWLAFNVLILWEGLTDQDSLGETARSIAFTQLATELVFLAASIVAVLALRRSPAGRNGGTAARADRAPTSSGPAAA
jgi:hypothetical protein